MRGGRSLSPSTESRPWPRSSAADSTGCARKGSCIRRSPRPRPLSRPPRTRRAQWRRTVCRSGSPIVMHLYPLCALRCVPLPWWSAANLRRALLLRAIDRRSLILANAGSERAAGAHAPVTLTRTRDGVRVDGTYEYMSLAHVADVVMFSAPLAGSPAPMFCAADLSGESVRIGTSRFGGSMRLSDTCSVTFDNHRVPTHRCTEIPDRRGAELHGAVPAQLVPAAARRKLPGAHRTTAAAVEPAAVRWSRSRASTSWRACGNTALRLLGEAAVAARR